MKSKFVFVALVVIGLVLGSVTMAIGAETPHRKIVVFRDGLSESEKEALVARFGEKVKDLKFANGKVALLSKKSEEKLKKESGILRIEDDAEANILARKIEVDAKRAATQPAESLPWGIDRIDAERVWGDSTGASIKVAVIDTGISLSHPDLASRVRGGYNAISSTKSANDDNGHGTHVAGIIGAIDNSIGVIGAAPNVDLYAVKVLNRNGSGYVSDIIEGIDWAIQNGMQIINMSLGATQDILSFHLAVQRAKNSGIVLVAAAGNDGGAVNYPAVYDEVIAVSASDSSDNLAGWSSRGPQIDLAAPGVSIFSTYKGSSYATLSGTSMAAPHVAGTAALLLATPVQASYDLNLNGKWDPDETQNKMQDTATDLGIAGEDDLYGFGLVNAFAATQ